MATSIPIDSISNSNNSQPTRPSISSQSFLYPHHPPDIATQLISTANSLVHPCGRGIYATDETPEAIETRLFAAANTGDDGKDMKTFSDEQKRERRRRWRECLYESLSPEHISGIILFSDTLHGFNLAPILPAFNSLHSPEVIAQPISKVHSHLCAEAGYSAGIHDG
ncbi:hypothetical protein BD410DRAFT_844266 [Rickenella mellea]|uniref:fructose-bisphosphate aldolase n=1 Tax=Rickenella mellea TaxID=50990 RepID=A0A4Y7PMG5_9AGAM|nr:hypothetical protein BD410DRAFT_844266 [Rickenella mellea]